MTDALSIPTVPLPGGALPLLGFGTWQIGDSDVTAAVETALQTGYRHIDTATMYRNERGIGRALARAGIPRAELFLTTKLPPERAGRESETLRASLDALGVDHVDLWLIHWPPDRGSSPAVWEQFVAAREAGLTKSIGVSNYPVDLIDELTRTSGETPAVNQIRWGPSLFDEAVVQDLADRGVVLEGYSPFKTTDLGDRTLVKIADELGATPAQVVIAWHVQHGFVVIPKSVHPDRIAANAAGAALSLSPEQVAAIDGLATTGRHRR